MSDNKKVKQKEEKKKEVKMMKKFIVTLMIAAMAITTLVGCGNSNNGSQNAGVSGLISVVSREDGSGTRGAFVELFGVEEKDEAGNKVDRTTAEAIVVNSTEVVLSNVAGDPNAIGYVSMGALRDGVKTLKIEGVEASTENVKNGTYPAPFFVYLSFAPRTPKVASLKS